MIIRIVKMTFRMEEVETFRALFESKKQLIRGFRDCVHLELWQDAQDVAVFFTYSHWKSEEALNKYRSSALFKEVWADTKALFAAKPEAWSVNRQTEVQLS